MAYSYDKVLAKTTYRSDITLLVKHNIYEFDIAKANINILLAKGVISYDKYNELLYTSRIERQVWAGKYIRDNNLHKLLKEGIIEYKYRFLSENNIDPEMILCIHNDSIFLIDTYPKVTVFDNIEFVNRGEYNSFIDIDGIEIYSFRDMLRNELSIRGLSLKAKQNHENFMFKFIVDILELLNKDRADLAISKIKDFRFKYLSRQVPIEYYRELTPASLYVTVYRNDTYYFESINKDMINMVDLSYNDRILRFLYAMICKVYLKK